MFLRKKKSPAAGLLACSPPPDSNLAVLFDCCWWWCCFVPRPPTPTPHFRTPPFSHTNACPPRPRPLRSCSPSTHPPVPRPSSPTHFHHQTCWGPCFPGRSSSSSHPPTNHTTTARESLSLPLSSLPLSPSALFIDGVCYDSLPHTPPTDSDPFLQSHPSALLFSSLLPFSSLSLPAFFSLQPNVLFDARRSYSPLPRFALIQVVSAARRSPRRQLVSRPDNSVRPTNSSLEVLVLYTAATPRTSGIDAFVSHTIGPVYSLRRATMITLVICLQL